jgi:ATP-binding cassette subfamily B protein/subfamily B ATP-binding cassette protein MsbA
MLNFRRALKDALKHWRSIGVASLCSFLVALLWSANIAAFYPILQVVLEDKSIQDWVGEQIDQGSATIKNVAIEQAKLDAQHATAQLDDRQYGLQTSKLAMQKSQAEGSIEFYSRMQPHVNRWLPNGAFETIVMIVGVLMISTVAKHVFLVTNELLVSRVAIDVTRALRAKLFSTALYMDRSSYAHHGMAGFSAHITHTTEGLTSGLVNVLGAAIREPLKIIGCVVGAAFINWRLLLLSALIAPFAGYVLIWITRRLKNVTRNILSQTSMFHEVMLESLNNLQTVQAYNMEDHEANRFNDSTYMMRKIGLKVTFFTALAKPVIEFLGIGMICTTIICGSYLVLRQKTVIFGIPVASEPMTVQALLTFFGMLVGMSDPLRKLSSIYSSIYTGSVAADAIYGILDQQNKIADPVNPKTVAEPHHKLELSQITFGYRPDHIVLDDVSVDIPFGSTVAIVGANGSGKSTMINLLCRFYDPNSGAVKLDGIDIKDMRIQDVRKRIALVTQQTELFNNSILYNILYGSSGATKEEAIAAAKAAHAHEFIENLPDGYETRVGHGGHRLSGGQRQRVSLARAILRNPEFLILDECTSQIDMHSERLIRQSLREHRGRRTMIIITHREALLELADVVYEVDMGKLQPIEKSELEKAA